MAETHRERKEREREREREREKGRGESDKSASGKRENRKPGKTGWKNEVRGKIEGGTGGKKRKKKAGNVAHAGSMPTNYECKVMVILISSAGREKMAVIKSRASPFLATRPSSAFLSLLPLSLSLPSLSLSLSLSLFLSLFLSLSHSSLARTLFRTLSRTYSRCIFIAHKVIEIQYVCRSGCKESPRFISMHPLVRASRQGFVRLVEQTTMKTG